MKIAKRLILLILSAALVLAVCAFASACGEVTLTFVTNGGTAVEAIKVMPGESVTLPETSQEGYAFEGWYTSEEYTGEALTGSVTAPDKSTTYYAKWAAAYRVTLDPDGGFLAEDTLYLKAGAGVLEALSERVPQKSGLTFGAWYEGETEITDSFRMPSRDLSLKARYQVEYSIEIYLLNLAGNSYVGDANLTATGRGYVGSTVTPTAPTVTGFTHTNTPKGQTPVSTLVLAPDAAENTFKLYYDRNSYRVEYLANAPAGLSARGSVASAETLYGGTATAAQNGFSVEGYRFAGWSFSPTDGEVACEAGGTFRVEGPMRLYAVWDRGFVDRFGSNDYIFFPRADQTTAILSRGGHEFTGKRDGDSFSFEMPSGKKLEGKTFGLVFSYVREDVEGQYVFYQSGADPSVEEEDRYDLSVTLDVDAYLNATFSQGDDVCEGELRYDNEVGDYVFTGEGRSFHCLFTKSEQGLHRNVFSVSGDEAGIYMDFWIVDEETGQGVSYGDMLLLDGYGSAVLYRSMSGYIIQFSGYYYITGEYEVSDGTVLKKLVCLIYDPYGLLADQEGWYLYDLYTMPLADSEYDGYIFADDTVGEYAHDGDTLTLDGYGFFPDSAVYTVNGVTYEGTYTYTSDHLTGVVVTVTSGEEVFRFLLDPAHEAFTPYTPAGGYAEYYRMNDGLDYPLIVLYERETEGGRAAELYLSDDGGRTVYLAAEGYYTSVTLGSGFEQYTFVRTQVIGGADVPERLVFYTTQVIGATDFRDYNVYCVLEWNGEKRYTEIMLEDGGKIWANDTVTLEGVGSLLFGADGSVTEGSFTRTDSTYFDRASTGTFLYGTREGNVRLDYRLSEESDGTLTAASIESTELELYFYYYDELYHQGSYVINLVLDGAGKAVWNDDYGYGAWQSGTYEVTGSTVFGEDIYSLTIGGAVRFRFIIYRYVDPYGGETPIYFLYNSAAEGSYSGAEGESLLLDGFYYASYTGTDGIPVEGTFSLNEESSTVYFTPTDGSEGRFFELGEENSFRALDAAYGEWYLVNSSYELIANSTIFFDGLGNLTISSPYTTGVKSGYYQMLDPAIPECMIYADLGGEYGYGAYRVQLVYFEGSGQYACVVYDESTFGTFVDDDWNVLTLDGYGYGALYTSDSGLVNSGYYYVVDADKGFLNFTFDYTSSVYGSEVFVVLGDEAFTICDYSQFGFLYLSEELDYLSFGTDGYINVGKDNGLYLVEGSEVTAYLYDYENEGYRKQSLPLPTGGARYSFGGKDYFLWSGQRIVLEGTIELLDREGEPVEGDSSISAKLSFLPHLGVNTDLDAVFTVEDEEYAGFDLNFYTNGELAPRVTYAAVDYSVTFRYALTGGTFTVRAGYVSLTMQDYRVNYYEAGHRGGRITKESIGFGPLVFGDPVYSGEFYYLYNSATLPEPISFESIDDVTVNAYRAGYGDGYEIVFTFQDVQYAIDFFEYETYYTLYSFYTYEDLEVGDYTVRVKYVQYTNIENTPGFGNLEAMRGKACGVTLFTEDGALRTLDTGVAVGGTAVWLVGYDETKPNNVGQGYLVNFTFGEDDSVSAAEVSAYAFAQALTSSRDHLIDYFLDEEGKVAVLLSVAYLDPLYGAYYWIDNTRSLKREENEFSFLGTADGTELSYRVTFTQAAGGSFSVTVKTSDLG